MMVSGQRPVDWIPTFASGIRFLGQLPLRSLPLIPCVFRIFLHRACLALLQGHTALVCQLQLSPTILATGGSDGRVITFSLETYSILQRIAAHDSSVTTLQFDENFLVTGGNDGRVRLFETKTGRYIRDLAEPAESVWKVGYVGNVCAIMCKRARKTVMEIWSHDPPEVELERVW